MTTIPIDLQLAQMRLRARTAGLDAMCRHPEAGGSDLVTEAYSGHDGALMVSVGRLGGRTVCMELRDLVALARLPLAPLADTPTDADRLYQMGWDDRAQLQALDAAKGIAAAMDASAKAAPAFGGKTFDPAKDEVRLSDQQQAVLDLMRDGQWRTLEEIWHALAKVGHHVTEAGISARLRDLRKPRHGAHTVERERVEGGNGLHRYRLRLRVQ
jgi:hypothetical protein